MSKKPEMAPQGAAPTIEPPMQPMPPAPAPGPAPVPPPAELAAPAPAPLKLVGLPLKLAKDEAPPHEHTVKWWALRKNWPAWLAAGMAAGHPVGQEFSEAEIEELARKVADLPLGRG